MARAVDETPQNRDAARDASIRSYESYLSAQRTVTRTIERTIILTCFKAS
jgi:hypothetical protein